MTEKTVNGTGNEGGSVTVGLPESSFDKQRRLAISLAAGLCGCWRCIRERDEVRFRMILCPTCGCKRCPRASDHDLTCTGSNDPGQQGSVYA